jgi:hypothetical protein
MGKLSPLCTGSVLFFAGVGGGLTGKRPVPFGTAEGMPRYLVERAWKPFFNDLGGSQMPFDEQFAGARALISADINLMDHDVLNQMESVPSLSGFPGINLPFDQGTFMVAEGAATPLWLVFTRALTPAMRAAKLPLGIRFLATWLMGPDTHHVGSDAKKVNLIWRAQRVLRPDFSWSFADNNITGLPPFKVA